jgi:hypothetical protein
MVLYVHARRLRRQPFAYFRLQTAIAALVLLAMTVSQIDLPNLQRQPEVVFVLPSNAQASASAATLATAAASPQGAVLVLRPAYAIPAGPLPPPRTVSTTSMRAGPGSYYAIVGLLPSAAVLDVAGRDSSGVWLAVHFPAGSKLVAWLLVAQVTNLDGIAPPEVISTSDLP